MKAFQYKIRLICLKTNNKIWQNTTSNNIVIFQLTTTLMQVDKLDLNFQVQLHYTES